MLQSADHPHRVLDAEITDAPLLQRLRARDRRATVLSSQAVGVMLTPQEVVFVLNDCGSRAIVTSLDKAAAVNQLRSQASALETVIVFGDGPENTVAFERLLAAGDRTDAVARPSPTSLSTIAYTSGTTGHPKGAMQSHLAVYLNCASTATMHVRTADDIVVTALPAPHVYGNVVINSLFMAGGTVVLMERFDPAEALQLIAQHRATLFEGVPAWARRARCTHQTCMARSALPYPVSRFVWRASRTQASPCPRTRPVS